MAPPLLHPRSRMTSSLFGATVVASFFVVALPHILPCPAPRRAFADGELAADGGRRKRRKRPQEAEVKDGIVQFDAISGPVEPKHGDDGQRSRRECPVPKPSGVVGELLGFRKPIEGQGDTRT